MARESFEEFGHQTSAFVPVCLQVAVIWLPRSFEPGAHLDLQRGPTVFGQGHSDDLELCPVRSRGRPGRGRTLEDMEEEEPEDDSRAVAEKKRELREAGVIGDESPREVPTDGPVGEVLGAPKSKCPTRHMNKGRIQTTMRDGSRFIYRVCSDCQKRIPEKTAGDKQAYRNQKTPKGVQVRDLSN